MKVLKLKRRNCSQIFKSARKILTDQSYELNELLTRIENLCVGMLEIGSESLLDLLRSLMPGISWRHHAWSCQMDGEPDDTNILRGLKTVFEKSDFVWITEDVNCDEIHAVSGTLPSIPVKRSFFANSERCILYEENISLLSDDSDESYEVESSAINSIEEHWDIEALREYESGLPEHSTAVNWSYDVLGMPSLIVQNLMNTLCGDGCPCIALLSPTEEKCYTKSGT